MTIKNLDIIEEFTGIINDKYIDEKNLKNERLDKIFNK